MFLVPCAPKGAETVIYGVISDIHGNREALDAVLARLGELQVDEIFCLGDIVGYGPCSWPRSCPGWCWPAFI